MASSELLTARPLSTQQVCPPPRTKAGGGGGGVRKTPDTTHTTRKSHGEQINQSWEPKTGAIYGEV